MRFVYAYQPMYSNALLVTAQCSHLIPHTHTIYAYGIFEYLNMNKFGVDGIRMEYPPAISYRNSCLTSIHSHSKQQTKEK